MKKQLLIIALLCAGVSTMEAKTYKAKDLEAAAHLDAGDFKSVLAASKRKNPTGYQKVTEAVKTVRSAEAETDETGVDATTQAVRENLTSGAGNQAAKDTVGLSGGEVALSFTQFAKSNPHAAHNMAENPGK